MAATGASSTPHRSDRPAPCRAPRPRPSHCQSPAASGRCRALPGVDRRACREEGLTGHFVGRASYSDRWRGRIGVRRRLVGSGAGKGLASRVGRGGPGSGGGDEADAEPAPKNGDAPAEGGQRRGLKKAPGADGPRSPKRPPWLVMCVLRTVAFCVVAAGRLWRALLKITRLSRLEAIMIFTVSLILYAYAVRERPPEILYSDFVSLMDKGAIQAVAFEEDSDRMHLTLKPEVVERLVAEQQAATSQSEAKGQVKGKAQVQAMAGAPGEAGQSRPVMKPKIPRSVTVRNIPGNTVLAGSLRTAGVRFGVVGASFQRLFTKAIGYMAVLWIPLVPLFWFLRRTMSSREGKKSSKAADGPKVKFADVAGLDSAKEELMEVVQLLKSPERYTKVNAKTPSGVLLCGPTGTGKTLLARAVAGEAEVPFFSASASEFVEMFVGRGAARIRDLFKDARKNCPCIVFVDEIDAVGGRRGYSYNDERDQTLNQLLVELDGFEGNPGIVLLAATNRPDTLDPALLRPGRLTRKVLVPLPDISGRQAILGVHLRDVPMGSQAKKEAAAEAIARLTNNFSGADLANTVNEAALLAARGGRDFVEFGDLVMGVQRTSGPVNSKATERGLGKVLQKGNEWFLNAWAKALAETQQQQPGPQAGG
ncbi:unnamed protein product [Ostreobium quekettii]|uniref:AAA+ ATPase domain-containing protein n=1 Tax=Ostreobium quekettii TaxID=121088 RepID=A0A8S1JA88_9CHLO|nr:unnamed protein product [Ostreobium quekettii]